MTVFVYFCLLLFGIDVASKYYIHSHFPFALPHGGVAVFKNFLGIDFSIVHATNTGAAWGIFSAFPRALLYFRIASTCGILIYLIVFKPMERVKRALLLILTGALGNVLDFFLYGHVVDMFYFNFFGYSYPVFNVADSAIFCGIVTLMIHFILQKKAYEPIPIK